MVPDERQRADEHAQDDGIEGGGAVAAIAEHDRRRGTDFCKTFPELAGFYWYCKDFSERLK